MRKRLSYLLVVAVFVSMLSLSGCGGGGGGGTTKSEANPYEGKWVCSRGRSDGGSAAHRRMF